MVTRPHAERLVVIAGSAGGIAALRRLLAALDRAFRWPIVVVLHLGSGELDGLLAVLRTNPALEVLEARPGARPRAGAVHVAPGGYHLLIEPDGSFALSVDERVCFVRPSADLLFSSAADAHGPGIVAIVLSGSNDDGARGLAAVRRRGGLALVQAPGEAEEAAMPCAALEHAGADAVLCTEDLARRLMTEFRK